MFWLVVGFVIVMLWRVDVLIVCLLVCVWLWELLRCWVFVLIVVYCLLVITVVEFTLVGVSAFVNSVGCSFT